jgi:two-component system response regulator AtoC
LLILKFPSLRERKEDIPVLAYSFVKEFAQKFDQSVKGIDDEAISLLQAYRWKGNVRELRNAMERAVLMMDGDEIKEQHFNFLSSGKQTDENILTSFELKVPPEGVKIEIVLKDLILKTLNITKGNQVKAAKVLGLSRSKLRYRMEQLGIEVTKSIQ